MYDFYARRNKNSKHNPKTLQLQSATWREYKHHNTVKILISVLPNSFINFISEPYAGRISEKAIVNETDFLSLIPPQSIKFNG
jgi:hypothetical protein